MIHFRKLMLKIKRLNEPINNICRASIWSLILDAIRINYYRTNRQLNLNNNESKLFESNSR